LERCAGVIREAKPILAVGIADARPFKLTVRLGPLREGKPVTRSKLTRGKV
jgi:hypothetical protein